MQPENLDFKPLKTRVLGVRRYVLFSETSPPAPSVSHNAVDKIHVARVGIGGVSTIVNRALVQDFVHPQNERGSRLVSE